MHRKICILIAVMAFVILSVGCAFGGVEINETNFPDPALREFVRQYDIGERRVEGSPLRLGENDGILSDVELSWVTGMNAPGTNLKGIEYFTALDTFGCRNNGVTEIDVSSFHRLGLLNCDFNKLKKLNVSNNPVLYHLHCLDNQIEALDVSHNPELIELMCNNNPIGKLDVSNNLKLEILVCGSTDLRELDVTNNLNLTALHCWGNHLTELDLSKNTALTEVLLGVQEADGLKVKAVLEGYEVCLNDYVSNVDNIELSSVGANDYSLKFIKYSNDNGKATVIFTEPPKTLHYRYNTHSPNNDQLYVIIKRSMNVDVIERGKGKDLIIGGIEDNRYLDANGNTVTELSIADLSARIYGKKGFVADGNSRLIMRVKTQSPGNVEFSVKENIGVEIERLSDRVKVSGVHTTDIGAEEYQASAVLIAPEMYPAGNFPSQDFTVHVKFTADETGEEIPEDEKEMEEDIKLEIHAAPVVLIPSFGINNGDSFSRNGQGVFPALKDLGFNVRQYDYGGTMSCSNMAVHMTLFDELLLLFEDYTRKNIVCTKADFVGYGMGGLIARHFCMPSAKLLDGNYYTFRSYGKGMVRRIVTVATPHRGTLWADYMNANFAPIAASAEQSLYGQLAYIILLCGHPLLKPVIESGFFHKSVDSSIWSDMSVASPLVNSFPENVPMHSVHGRASTKINEVLLVFDTLKTALDSLMIVTSFYRTASRHLDLYRETHYASDIKTTMEPLKGKKVNAIDVLADLSKNDSENLLEAFEELKEVILKGIKNIGLDILDIQCGSGYYSGHPVITWIFQTTMQLASLHPQLASGPGGWVSLAIDIIRAIPHVMFGINGDYDCFVSENSATADFGNSSLGFDGWQYRHSVICHNQEIGLYIAGLLKSNKSMFKTFSSSTRNATTSVMKANTYSNDYNDISRDIDPNKIFATHFTIVSSPDILIIKDSGATHITALSDTDVDESVYLIIEKGGYDTILPMISTDIRKFESQIRFDSRDAGIVSAYCFAKGDEKVYTSPKIKITVMADISSVSIDALTFSHRIDKVIFMPASSDMPASLTANLRDGSEFDVSSPLMGTSWTSSNPSVAYVTEDGMIRSLADGSATLTATYAGLTASIIVNVGNESSPPEITSQVIDGGNVGKNYSAILQASGTPIISWRIIDGRLPFDLTLSDSGTISGYPTEEGTFTFTAEASNIFGADSHDFTIIIGNASEAAIMIEANNFPDDNFRAFISNNLDWNHDGFLTEQEINGITAIDVSNMGIKSLKGIEYFTALVYLTCNNNELTELDLSQNANIYGVACQNNKLERINLANCSKLFQIWLDNNKLVSVDFTHCPALNILSCKNNLITTLDLRRQANITDLQCDEGVEIIYSDTPGGSEILIDANNFPDNAFRKLIADKFDWNKDGSLNASEINAITGIEAVNMGIKSLKGIEKFTALEYLTCNNNELEEIDLSGNPNFIGLAANNNRLQRVNVSKNPKLYQIWVNNNKLRALDFSQNPELAIIDCSKNLLTELDISANANLRELYFVNYPDEGSEDVDYHTLKGNAIRNIDLSNAPLLTHLACSANGIETLDISNNPLLEYIECHNNYLTKIDAGIFTELKYLHISGNKISTLDVSQNTKLQELHCGDNLLETLTLGDKPGLLKLYCYRNNLTALNVKGCPAMKELSFGGNKISAIDITNNQELESLAFWDNFVTVLDISEHVKLKDCIFGNNKVKTLNVGNKPELLRLHCYSNDLSTVDITGCPALQDFSCEGNKISVLDVTKCKELETLYCRDNPLKVLDLSECPKITNLTVDEGVKLIYAKEGTLPEILTKTLTNAITNQKYSYQLTASGATPITWTCAGKLPAGLTLSDSGLISGTPTEAGKSTFTVTAQNDYGKSSQKYTLQVFESVSITTASLKAGTIEKSYSVTLKASGTTPITWSATGLPAGLTIDSSTGKISGTPTQSGSFSVKITAKNSYSSSTKTLKLFVGVAPSITTKSLKNATLNKSYGVTLKASGTTPITWTAAGLPTGLTIDSKTGKISGNPTGSGSFDVNFTAENSYGTSTKTLSLFVGVAPSITTKTLKNATLKKAYSVTLKANGTTPITWSATGLPKGLSIAKGSNVISGTPTKSGSFDVKITAKNSHGSSTKTLSLFVGVAPSITTSSLKNATLNKSYSVTLKASGTTPVTWSAKGLPAGLTIDSSTGKISGTPTKSGSSSVKITAKNSHGSNTKTLKLFVGIPASITTKSLTYGLVGKSYSVALKADGTATITWSLKSGSLPEGLTLTENGKISGKPTKSESSTFTVMAKNAYGSSTKKLTLKVYALPNITTKTLKNGTVAKSYSVTLKATGSGTITWTATGLPSGLSINKSTGKISGKPKVAGTFTVSVKATSTYGSKTKKFSLTISDASSNAENYTEDYSSIKTLQTLSGTTKVQAAPSATAQTESYFIAYVFDDVISVDKAGLYDFNVQLDEETPEGWSLVWIANSDKPSDDDEIVDFYDCDGAPIEVVPHDKKISVSVWLNPDRIYEPAIAVKK